MSKDLLLFAHRGEAQSFLKNEPMSSVPHIFDGLYVSDKYFLLITGEGYSEASIKVASVLEKYRDDIARVINLGICGSLEEKNEIGSIVEIRTHYLERDGHFEFKSFSSHALTTRERKDILTTSRRILNELDRSRLDNIAPLIDRESWGMAQVCHVLKKPFHAIKLISDHAGADGEFCQVVKELAHEWSEKLFEVYQKEILSSVQKDLPRDEFDIPDFLKSFHFTLSQKRELKNLLHSLSLKGVELETAMPKALLSEIENEKIRAKDKTQRILSLLTHKLNPFHHKVQSSIDTLTASLNRGVYRLKNDPTFESDELYLHATLSHQRHVEQLIEELSALDLEKIHSILRGNIDV